MHRLLRLLPLTLAACLLLVPAAADAKKPAKAPIYRIGLGSADLSLTQDEIQGKFGQFVYLGGYGLGNGRVGDSVAGVPNPGPRPSDNGLSYDTGRAANGNLGDGPHVRAAYISTGKAGQNWVIADIESQGCFTQNKQGFGLITMREQATAAIAALVAKAKSKDSVPADHIDIQCDHSHGGTDLIGAWGGVPTEYLQRVQQQTVNAIVAAYKDQQKATLWYGTAPAGVQGRGDNSKMDNNPLLTNQMGGDPTHANDVMDDELKVLQARDPDTGAPLATLLDLGSHADVLGSSNLHATGDWPQVANTLMMDDAGTFGPEAMTLVGTLGRQQPARGDCPDKALAAKGDSDPQSAYCKLTEYSKRVVARATLAVHNATEVTGKPAVVAKTYFIQDPATNGGIMALNDAGEIGGAPIMRANLFPWKVGNVVGTVTGSIRIGDILISSMPGEAYPQIPLALRAIVANDKTAGIKGFMTLGLSDDQLGYIIANLDDGSYAYPIERGVVDQNDNILFNMSQTLGERLTCSLLRGAGDVTGAGTAYRDSDQKCNAFANDLAWPEGQDTAFPALPVNGV